MLPLGGAAVAAADWSVDVDAVGATGAFDAAAAAAPSVISMSSVPVAPLVAATGPAQK